MAKVMIEAAINGNAMKKLNPHIAYSPADIAADAIATCKAGAALIHFHVRNPETGKWVHDVPLYAEVYRRTRAVCKALLWPTFHSRRRRGLSASAISSSCRKTRRPSPTSAPATWARSTWSATIRQRRRFITSSRFTATLTRRFATSSRTRAISACGRRCRSSIRASCAPRWSFSIRAC